MSIRTLVLLFSMTLIFTSGLAVVACGQPAPQQTDRLDRLFSGELEVVDLTHALSTTGPFWPNPSGNPFEHEILRAHESGAAAMARYATPEHHGTHLDAPIHAADHLPTVDELTAADLFGPAVVVDVSRSLLGRPRLRFGRR